MKIAAGQFKAKCLKLMDNVYKNNEEVIITKYGKPIAKLVQFVVQDSTQYIIAENWENQTALDLHNKKERLKSFVRNISQYLIEDCKISMSY